MHILQMEQLYRSWNKRMFLQKVLNTCPIYMLIFAVDFRLRTCDSIPVIRIINALQLNSAFPIAFGAEKMTCQQWHLATWAYTLTFVSYARHQNSAQNMRRILLEGGMDLTSLDNQQNK